MIIGTIISSITGILTSLFQDWWHQKLIIAKQEKDLEIELKRKEAGLIQCDTNTINNAYSVSDQLNVNTEQTYQLQIQEDSKNENNIINAAIDGGQISRILDSRLLNFANFFIAVTRPAITFLLGGLIAFIQIYTILYPENFNILTEQYFMIMEATFYLFDGTLSFWFMRRSSDKFSFNRGYAR